jgi:hypothetical protein
MAVFSGLYESPGPPPSGDARGIVPLHCDGTAMAKGKAGKKRTKATKRNRCMICGKYGHKHEDCLLLEKSEDTELAGVVHTLPIADNIDDDGKEASV